MALKLETLLGLHQTFNFLESQARSINLGGILIFATVLEDIYEYSGLQFYEYSSPQIILLLASLSMDIHA